MKEANNSAQDNRMTPPSTAGRIGAHGPIDHQIANHVGWAGIFAHPTVLLFAAGTAIKFGNQLLVIQAVLQKRPTSVG